VPDYDLVSAIFTIFFDHSLDGPGISSSQPAGWIKMPNFTELRFEIKERLTSDRHTIYRTLQQLLGQENGPMDAMPAGR
jgi:hypothetical protein